MQLHHKGSCGMSEISERFDVTPAAASQLVDKLVQSGYLERAEDPSDRRARLLKLSPAGLRLVEEGINERYRWMDELVKNLSVEEKAKVSEALDILTRAAQAVDN
jgi:DNA-binding MarR family transcriptional regulator